MYQQPLGYKVDEKLYLVVREQRRLNTTGLEVSVLVIGPKVRGLKPGRGQWILWAIQNCSTTSFGWEVKPSVACR
jgi:hypothetical protein